MQSPIHEHLPALVGQSLRVLIWDRDLVDMWCLDASGARLPYRGRGSTWHCHPELELTLITQGEGILCVGDHIGRFTAPDCLLLGTNLPHVWRADGAMAGISLQIQVDVDMAGGLGAVPELAELGRLWNAAGRGVRWQGATARTLLRLAASLESAPAVARMGVFLTMLAALQASSPEDALPLSQTVLGRPGPGPSAAAMERVVDHVMTHYREDLSLSDLVAMSGTSPATFHRHFVRMTGKTFIGYLQALRIQEVRRALTDTSRSITDIAFSAGFNNLSHFHAVFRRAMGCTPGAFRRSLT